MSGSAGSSLVSDLQQTSTHHLILVGVIAVAIVVLASAFFVFAVVHHIILDLLGLRSLPVGVLLQRIRVAGRQSGRLHGLSRLGRVSTKEGHKPQRTMSEPDRR